MDRARGRFTEEAVAVRRAVVGAVVLLAALAAATPATAQVRAAVDGADQHDVALIVRMRPGAAGRLRADVDHAARRLARRHGARAGVVLHGIRGIALRLPARRAAALVWDPDVLSVERDLPIALAADTVPAGVARVRADAWSGSVVGAGTAVDADIAILDTGVSPHPDLTIAGGVRCIGGCGAGTYDDGHGHGTHVAGIAAARADGVGIVGTAPGARVWAVKIMGDNGTGSLSDFLAALDWVVARGDIEVVNASLGGLGTSAIVEAAVDAATDAGVVVVVAAGNDAADAGSYTPANTARTITVSAFADTDGRPGGIGPASACGTGGDDAFASFSNYGAVVDVAAPGVCISSTSRTGGGYVVYSGTSMAAPHVAGAAAAYIAANGVAATPSRWSTVRDVLRGAWGAAPGTACGYSGALSSEPALVMGGCAAGGAPLSEPAPAAAPAPSAAAPVAVGHDRRVTLSWETATATGGVRLVELWRAAPGQAATKVRSLRPSVTTFTDNRLTNGATYRYHLVVVDRAGGRVTTASTDVVPVDDAGPATPKLTGRAADGRVTLRWKRPSDTTGVGSYTLERAVADGPLEVVVTLDPAALEHVDTAVVNGTAYRYVLTATDALGNPSRPSRPVKYRPSAPSI